MARRALVPRDINIMLPEANMPSKGFLSAYDIMKLSPLNSPPPSVVGLSHVGGVAQAPPLPSVRATVVATMETPLRGSPVAIARNSSPGSRDASVVSSDSNSSNTSADIATEWVQSAILSNDLYQSQMQGMASLLPPAWEDLLRIVANLPGDEMDETPPETPPPTTIGLMVKQDPEKNGLGIVTGCVEGSSADLSGELVVGDLVLAVDGTPFNHPDALKKMRGGQAVISAGTELHLMLERRDTGVFECKFVREPYPNVQLKREVFDLLSHLKDSFGILSSYIQDSQQFQQFDGDKQIRSLFQSLHTKLVALEKCNINALRLLRSEVQRFQQLTEQIVKYIKLATADGAETIRSLMERIEKQEEKNAQLDSADRLTTSAKETYNEIGKQHVSDDQMHLLRHECNRLRSTLQSKETELEGLREKFDQKLDEQGLRDAADNRSMNSQSPRHEHRRQLQTTEATCAEAIASELQSMQNRLEHERESNQLALAAIKRDLWVSVIRRWLNNCCRRIITGWRNLLGRKHYYRVVCSRLEQGIRMRCNRCRLMTAFGNVTVAWFQSKRLRHAGVTASSGWMFLGVRRHLHAWLAHVDWKAYTQRFESKSRAKTVARAFHCWSRIASHCPPGLDSDMVTTIMSTLSSPSTPRAAQILAQAKATLKAAEQLKARTSAMARSKLALVDKGMQSLRWESDASVQCSLDTIGEILEKTEAPNQALARRPSRDCVLASLQSSPVQSTTVQTTTSTSTGSQCNMLEDSGFKQAVISYINPLSSKKFSAGAQQESNFVVKSMQEKLSSEQKESRRLRESLVTAQEAIRRQEDFLKCAQDSDRRLKESLQMAHTQLHRTLKDASEDKRRAAQLSQLLEQVERKLLMSQEEREELRSIVADERRINARIDTGKLASMSHPRISYSAKRLTIPESRELIRANVNGVATIPSFGVTNSSSKPDSCMVVAKVSSISTQKMRILCLNMALSKQWRRIAIIFVSWGSFLCLYKKKREGTMRLTARRFYAIMRRFVGVWFHLCKRNCRIRVLLAINLAQRWRRVMRSVLRELKRSAFTSRASRELYDLNDSISSPNSDEETNSDVNKYEAPSSITRTRLKTMAEKIQDSRRTMKILDTSAPNVSTDVQKYEVAFRSAEAVINELAQRIEILERGDVTRKILTSPPKTEPTTAPLFPNTHNKCKIDRPSAKDSREQNNISKTRCATGAAQGSVSPPPTTFEGVQDTMLAASHGLMLAHTMPTTLPQKPPVTAGVEKHKTDRNSERRYRVLSELTTTCSDHHYIQEPESTPWHRKRLNSSREYLSPRQTAVADACASFENSRLPPTPSEYSTGPGNDGKRGSPSPQITSPFTPSGPVFSEALLHARGSNSNSRTLQV